MARFDHAKIEADAQKKWAEEKLYELDLSGKNPNPYYLLFEFPYPSGDLHMGHWYAYAVTDIFARFKRMQGYQVLFPIGFDAFGLPAENAAIKNGADPKAWTYANIERMKAQIRTMGSSLDWSKELVTADPEYYRWTQWLFAKFYEQGLAIRKEAAVKWCPKDKTVLANEQVVDGKCERCDTPVEEKSLTQWFMKITDYADRLLADLDELPWREDIKEAQRAWIGKSEGAKLSFQIAGEDDAIWVFTTRPDTLYGVTYLVVAPEHPLALRVSAREPSVKAYLDLTKAKTERERSENREKSGVRMPGIEALNPLSGEKVPVFVADYVLGSYGTGAVMAVPAHDERDFEFAKKHGLAIRRVIEGGELPFAGRGVLVDSGSYTGKDSQEAMGEMVREANGEPATNYRMRDWLVSRQRYWGCPIPVVYDPEGKAHLVPDEHLPWRLPEDVDFSAAETNGSPLSTSRELRERVTRLFGEGWTPEYDTLDTFVDSSWYFLRYLSPRDDRAFSSMPLMKQWLPIDRYSGGAEHTTMHLLYSRFFYKALYDLALVPTKEPFHERFNRGLILGTDGQKMSKRWGNVVNPDDMVERYGADAVRTYLAFIGPYNEPGNYPWNLDGVAAIRKFLERVHALAEKIDAKNPTEETTRLFAKTAHKAAEEIERFKYNTALAALMVLVRHLETLERVPASAYLDLVRMMAPFTPHLAEHWYASHGGEGSVHASAWPAYDPSLLAEDAVVIAVQIGGKRRGEIQISPTAPEEEAVAAALKVPEVAAHIGGAAPARVVYVPGRVLNLVPK